jgi:Outer membrane protein beta-barrel domain
MYHSHLWNLLNLRWKKIGTVLFLVCLLCQISVAQSGFKYRPKYQEGYEDKNIHFGFLFALPSTRFNFIHSNEFLSASDSVSLITAPITQGFRMGFVFNKFLNDHWDIRTTPSVSLYERVVEYQFLKGSTRREIREATWIEIPLLVKYKSQRRMNSRMYMLAGVTFGFETNVRRRQLSGTSRLTTGTTDLTLDYGFGFEQFLPYTKLSPEIRFSHGLVNMYKQAENPTTLGLSRLTSHSITLYLMFE